MAKKRGELQKKDPYLESGNFFRGGPNRKVVAPDVPVICPVRKS